MSDLKNIQDAQNSNRKQSAAVNIEIQKAQAALEKLNADEKEELKSLNEQERESKKLFNEKQRNQIIKDIGELRDSKKSIKANYEQITNAFLAQLDPIKKITELNDNIPILMFPLRLETRFKSTGNQKQLWLRVYPDDCNINSKEELLSESELKNAKAFWIEMWKAGGIKADEKAAWRSLVNSHGTGRSAYIIKEYKPTNSKTVRTSAAYKIFVVNSSLSLSPAEKDAATKYWSAFWFAKGDAVKIDKAKEILTAATNSATATSIQENYIPENITDEIPEQQDSSKIIISEIDLPDYTAKNGSWTQSAKTMGLPNKFVVTTFDGNVKKTILFNNPVKDHLAISVDPSLTGDDQLKKDDDKNLILNDELSWMVDFEKAEQAGMATKIDLTPEEAQTGFKKLFVTGIRFTSDEADGQEQLETLFTDHFYSKNGLELIKQGAPTNNTEDAPAAYTWTDNGDDSFDSFFSNTEDFVSADTPDKKSDGEKLADCLGIDPAILKNVKNANGKDQLEAYAMNTALFPATLGYFMDEMMDPLFTDRDIEATKAFFAGFVSGRGPIPAIRIGKQPYGILPISVYSKLNFLGRDNNTDLSNNIRTPFLPRLHRWLMKMDSTWDELLIDVAHIGKTTDDAHKLLLKILALNANSVEFHQRYAQSKNQMHNQLNLQHHFLLTPKFEKKMQEKAKQILNELGIDTVPILEKFFLSRPNLLSGPFIDDVPDSETSPIRPYSANGLNYIEWLVATAGDTVRRDDFGGQEAPTALLYLLLKHALTQSQSNAAAKVLATNNLIASRKVFKDPDFLHVEAKGIGKSKYEHLFNTYPTITGDASTKLIDYIQRPNILHNLAETEQLKETIDALKILEKTPTASLERLLTEHLDCCSYRIDAWKTGLVQYKLTEQRLKNSKNTQPSKGIYLGAYGWLMDVEPQNKLLTNETLTPELNEIFNKENIAPLQSDSKNLGFIHAPSLDQAATAAILRNAYDSNKDAGSGNPFAINLTSDRVRVAANFLEGMRNGQPLAALLGYQFERGLHDKYNLGKGEVDKFILPLRKVFPLVADNLVDTKSKPEENEEMIAANNVLDGLKFINYVREASVKVYPFGLALTFNLPTATPDQAKAIKEELDYISDINDAVSDLVMAEQVYQVVQGNFERASGNANAFSKGDYPPDIDIINTPRSGVTLTHRMAIQFDSDATVISGAIARAKAEPAINKWLIDNLPAPENVICNVVYSTPLQADIPITISQKELGLEAIDLLYVLNTDTEQSMTELDDRILNFVRYTKSNHPKTTIKINYTEAVNTTNKANVSFFELAALIKSLRKILIGSKTITPTQVLLSTESATPTNLDDVKLKTTVENLIDIDFDSVKTSLENISTNTHSFTSISAQLSNDIGTLITDPSIKDNIIIQLKSDLKNYLADPNPANKATILTAFENSINSIGVPSTINTLKTAYDNYLELYANDFVHFDTLVKDISTQYLKTALFDNVQTGIGFIHSGVTVIYENVFTKLDILIERWGKKLIEAELIMSAYNTTADPDEKIELLQKAEQQISSVSTFPVLPLAAYKTAFDTKKADFISLLNNIKALKTNNKTTIIDFLSDVNTTIKEVSLFDTVAFDTVTESNNTNTELLQLALLKEDIVVSLNNLQKYIEKKIINSKALIAEADATVVNADKIAALIKAAKTILGDEALLLPRFTLNSTSAAEFNNALTDKDQLLSFIKATENSLFPVEDWLGGIARVRDKAHHWENIVFLTDAFKPTVEVNLTALQFPYQSNDRWLAVKFREDTATEKDENGKYIFNIKNDKLLYTAHFAKDYDNTKPQCGIVIDEWTEVIPANEETTGIAFHYDQPNSEPPQTMFLVTPPQITGNWKWNDIIESMEETLEMAKKRAVEPAQIESSRYGQFLPATIMAVSMHWITASINLAQNNNIYKKINNG